MIDKSTDELLPMPSTPENTPLPQPSSLHKAYPWLLAISTCLSAALCWMYVTKPVIDASPLSPKMDQGIAHATSMGDKGAQTSSSHKVEPGKPGSDLIPSDNALPGVPSAEGASATQASRLKTPRAIDPRQLAAGSDGSGWETTNSRVQHILSADTGNGDLTKIVLNVPVLYQTRTMRWTPSDIEKARGVLTRLMVYEGNLAKIKKEGEALLVDWNQILEKTVPAKALRADSPSLPYNQGDQSRTGGLPDSGNTIKIEH